MIHSHTYSIHGIANVAHRELLHNVKIRQRWSKKSRSVLTFDAGKQPDTWLSTALSIVALRKVLFVGEWNGSLAIFIAYRISATRMPTTSPLSSVKVSLANTSTKAALAVYMVSPLCMALIHATADYVAEQNGSKLSLLVKSKCVVFAFNTSTFNFDGFTENIHIT